MGEIKNHFRSPNLLIPGTVTLDMEALLKLSDEEFSKWYVDSMSEYFPPQGTLPKCWTCAIKIKRPEELRRYYGRSEHPDCFKRQYEQDLKSGLLNPVHQQYWDRIVRMKAQ